MWRNGAKTTYVYNWKCIFIVDNLGYIEEEINKDKILIYEPDEIPEAPPPREMLELESTLDKLDHELREVTYNAEQLQKSYIELTELKLVLRMSRIMLERVIK